METLIHKFSKTSIAFLVLSFFTFKVNALTFNVNSNADAGAGTLRQAILDINASADPGPHVISFASLPVAQLTITLSTELPSPTKPVTFDGYTAPNYVSGNPSLQIRGSSCGVGAGANSCVWFHIIFNNTGANGSVVRGIGFHRSNAHAIEIRGVSNITVEGCRIGLPTNIAVNPTGTDRLINHGILIVNSSNITVGGTTAQARNVISASASCGMSIENSTNVQIIGNYIGLNPAGDAARANTSHGINIVGSSSINIGGTSAGQGNVISGNSQSGVNIDLLSSSITVAGNYIGTRADGTAALANGSHGVNVVNSSTVVIGGTTSSHRNIISGNGASGINVAGGAHGTVIKSNYIGTNAAGTAAILNGLHGVFLTASNNCIIGGPSAGERNVVSGNGNANGENGISIESCNGHTIQGNYIGTNAAGTGFIRNYDTGLSLTNSSGNTIGGATAGERNVISGNGTAGGRFGIYFSNVDASIIRGNFIGVDVTGNVALANVQTGFFAINGSDGNTIRDNIISGNGAMGIDFYNSSNNNFYGNYVGLGFNGTTNLGNNGQGIRIGGASSTNNRIGGTGAGERNFVAGNRDNAIMLDQGSNGNFVTNNYVGTDITGLTRVSNRNIGIFVHEGSPNNTVQSNLSCCSETNAGIAVQVSSGNLIYGNIVGLDANLNRTAGFGNFTNGIHVGSHASGFGNTAENNIIGGTAAGQPNIVANNGAAGVLFAYWGSGTSRYNRAIGNSIYCNVGAGIAFESTVQEGVATPTVTTRTTAIISGGGTNGCTVHLYRNNTSGTNCDCEGEQYTGLSTTVAGGTWSFNISGLGLTQDQVDAMTVTQTTTNNSTSRFSLCTAPLPVTLTSFKGWLNDNGVELNWITASEKNNKHFIVQKSMNSIDFFDIGIVQGRGNSNQINKYSLNDDNLFEGTNYYRLIQVDYDGTFNVSDVIVVNGSFAASEVQIWPNPAQEGISIGFASVPNSSYQVIFYNLAGAEVKRVVINSDSGNVLEFINIDDLVPSAYNVKVIGEDMIKMAKVVKY
ncbi:MAG: hypothetical protein ACK40G_12440 [Cytophagaceae bacterium]